MQAELTEDRDVPGQYRVECILDDGSVEVAIFSGPHALDRAICLAGGSSWYSSWGDPQALAGM